MSNADHKFIRVIKGRRPKVVVIGGGTGLPVVVKSLHDQHADVTAVVTVADDGGSSGIIRDYINVVPPGDIRNVLVALSDMPAVQRDIFQYRFNSKDSFFAGHAIGNLIIAALSEMRGGIFEAVQELSDMMQVDGHVYPASNTPLTLHARFKDGSEVAGEAEITAAGKQIDTVSVTRSNDGEQPVAEPEIIQAIMDADVVVLGPGSLFTSILPNLMIHNLGDAVLKTQAEVIYIVNIMTQKGETDNFTDADHVRVLNRHMKENFVDTVLVNIEKVPAGSLDEDKYVEISKPVRSDYQGLRDMGCRVISSDFLELRDGGVFHDGRKVAQEIMNLAFQSHLKKGR
ncbi:uridine diphosphate-N-acetylglucosamine-binding protein YvcK [Lacticaseibacillus pabuli]|uniref:Putative gluconeogenesis factor n=1 Tax=Lacticaseibacillus pabuli TaxID=3025672 RepID=A0ABY7WSJ9_9LACO|nr:uridine diphosphate-N-acetylglucosamine-binding protein YvcK [Lacticaseibacillus sp. KACC 23028]WDF81967.1 uridine diphosphate-N-acetylglucosamine-binding protein YvcK [Lacticaseibacillus sp. KACC 23028]